MEEDEGNNEVRRSAFRLIAKSRNVPTLPPPMSFTVFGGHHLVIQTTIPIPPPLKTSIISIGLPITRRLGTNPRRIEYMDGGYIFCGAGMFTGRTIRAEVEEVQKANVGRKYAASKDRRALHPPPVVGRRIFDVRDAGNGTTHDTELDYRGVQAIGLICHVEAF
ncbi:hypothetical protein BJ322DRAFT_1025561 [Thelephora terrestris]|uniref:Velvet domain-containing protein n=1 Tax=Thelephora terrestris TaxID=56493 RepID=A0A9P6L0E1_9AGAM|nr:hypothetical protein BJ322DRAFT_1025561 [Thelephora terrestris]